MHRIRPFINLFSALLLFYCSCAGPTSSEKSDTIKAEDLQGIWVVKLVRESGWIIRSGNKLLREEDVYDTLRAAYVFYPDTVVTYKQYFGECMRSTIPYVISGNRIGGARAWEDEIIQPGNDTSFRSVRYNTIHMDGPELVLNEIYRTESYNRGVEGYSELHYEKNISMERDYYLPSWIDSACKAGE